jgi:hypothetical protein
MPSSPALIEEAHAICKAAAEPWRAGELMKTGIRRSARALGISYRQPVTITADEIDHLRAWAAKHAAVLADIERQRELLRQAAAETDQLAIRGERLAHVVAGDRASVGARDQAAKPDLRRAAVPRRAPACGLAFPSSEFFGAIGR